MAKIQCELAIDSIHHVVILVKLVNSVYIKKAQKCDTGMQYAVVCI